MGGRQAACSCPLELVDSGDRSLVLHFGDALLLPSKPGEQWGRAKEGVRRDSGYGKGREQEETSNQNRLGQGSWAGPSADAQALHHPWVMVA